MVLEVGVLCTDTQRLITFTEQEVMDVIDNIPDSYTMGSGKDAILCTHRGFEDYEHRKNPVFLTGRILGPISEDLYEKVCWSYIQEPLVDYIAFQGNLTKIHNVPVTPNSPWEMLAEMKCISIVKDVCRRGLPSRFRGRRHQDARPVRPDCGRASGLGHPQGRQPLLPHHAASQGDL